MKKLIITLLSLTLCVSYVGCSNDNEDITKSSDSQTQETLEIQSESDANSDAPRTAPVEPSEDDITFAEKNSEKANNEESKQAESKDSDVKQEETKQPEVKQEETKQPEVKQEETKQVEQVQDTAPEKKSVNVDWQGFISEYEAWMNLYLDATEKYKADPDNAENRNNYNTKISELNDWGEKYAKISKEMENAPEEDAIAFSVEYSRIMAKFAESIKGNQ